ncbi:hypothetical protein HHI36_013354 [Cryptolaemus montrouzieri]|uniref:Uncharacterized protein n=1 Tax=Cryptolaemus montrouzieri TaxID=559131 RepID=A0ABD2NGY2_9CUCU
MKAQIRSLGENGTEKLLGEIHDRMVRSSNIMIYDVEESKSVILSEKISNDKEIVSNFLRTVDVNDSNILKVVRVRRIGIKPRPIKAVLSSPQVVNDAAKTTS